MLSIMTCLTMWKTMVSVTCYSETIYIKQQLVVHRIGRTGRSSKQGIATTFINKANDESVLLDLKHLLIEANQKVPQFLAELRSENEHLDLGGEQNFWLTVFLIFL